MYVCWYNYGGQPAVAVPQSLAAAPVPPLVPQPVPALHHQAPAEYLIPVSPQTVLTHLGVPRKAKRVDVRYETGDVRRIQGRHTGGYFIRGTGGNVGQSALPGGLRQLDMDEACLVCVVDFELRFVYMLMTRASSINGWLQPPVGGMRMSTAMLVTAEGVASPPHTHQQVGPDWMTRGHVMVTP
ncbi:hypothetical protein C0Q70_15902 [Pomacea canaliculata]|uniref:Uncharacterized protein n=1 Tax=Pomacea canaliculata TaxID=400727 RepID=A0A2T7NN96_POMCA|nr:hypothetical protein C0Q70_15902 [Pomacea canaliculata]